MRGIGDRLTPNAALVRFRGSDRMTVAEVEKRMFGGKLASFDDSKVKTMRGIKGVVRVGDKLYDGSVANRLATMRTEALDDTLQAVRSAPERFTQA